MVSRTQTLTAKKEALPGPGWGCSRGHSCSAQIQQRASQVALGQRVLPGQGEGDGTHVEADVNPTRALPEVSSICDHKAPHLASKPSVLEF